MQTPPSPRTEVSRPPAEALAAFGSAERAQARRLRVAFLGASVATLAALLIAPAPAPSSESERARRWGFLGPERVVSIIEIPNAADAPPLLVVDPGEESRRTDAAAGLAAEPGPSPRVPGRSPRQSAAGADALSARDLMRASLPTVRSEELVMDVLVKPEYPRDAQARGLEAIVELEAFVDIDGTVRETHVLSNTGDPAFAEAATHAVTRCRFRPYREGGTPTPVFARFRFNFHLI